MKLKEQEWSKCECCGRRDKIIQEETFGCDWCGTVMGEKDPYLKLTVFHKESSLDTTHYQFDTWACLLSFLKKVKNTYFIDLPYLSVDDAKDRALTKEFFTHIKIKNPRRKFKGKKAQP